MFQLPSSSIQTKFQISASNNLYEQGANLLAFRIIPKLQSPSIIQGKCEDCEEEPFQMKQLAESITPIVQKQSTDEEEEIVQPKSESSNSNNPNLSSQLTQSEGRGRGMPRNTNQLMSNAFGTDFTYVHIHTDTDALQMNRSLNARAFTHGSDIYFNEGHYRPDSTDGKRLLAHELTRVVQQRAVGKSIQLSPDLSARETEEDGTLGPDISTSPSFAVSPPASPNRGTNPTVCFPSLCTLVAGYRSRPPSNRDALFRIADSWGQSLIICVRGNAARSNASHANDIVTDTQQEVNREITTLKTWFTSGRNNRRRRRSFIDKLVHLCRVKAKEVMVEFHFNVVFQNPIGEPPWARNEADWDRIFSILSMLPVGTLWNLPNTLRIRRERCFLENGVCNRRVGGETDVGQNRISIFNTGMQRTPFTRSRSINLPGDYQSLIHEVGHVAYSRLSRAEKNQLFTRIMDWRDYPWFWVNFRGTGSACATSRTGNPRERCNICTDLNMISGADCDNPRIDTWLRNMRPGTTLTHNNRRWWRPTEINQHHIHSVPTANLPTGRVFDYANTEQGEYFSELYALAITRPVFLDSAIPAAQAEWFRRVVFQVPTNRTVLQTMVMLPEPQMSEFNRRVVRLFTWEQVNSLINQLSRSTPIAPVV